MYDIIKLLDSIFNLLLYFILDFLYESFKMYAINKTEIQMSAYYSTRRNCTNNQVINI